MSKLINEIINIEGKKIHERYRISKEEVEKILKNRFKNFVFAFPEYEKIRKTRAYRDIIKNVKRDIYYSLRKYHSNEEDAIKCLKFFIKNKSGEWDDVRKKISLSHSSSAEREPYIKKFNREIIEIVKDDEYILDLGCGFYPLSFPFDKVKKLKKYYCLDNNQKTIETIKLFSKIEDKVEVISGSLFDQNWDDFSFDTVFMFKLIPVIYRQKKSFLNVLSNIPANKMIITANKESLTRRQIILKREDRVLKEFIELSNREVKKKLDFESEFGYLLD